MDESIDNRKPEHILADLEDVQQDLLSQIYLKTADNGVAPDPATGRWPLVRMPFYGDLNLGRSTRYTAGVFLKGHRLFVGVQNKGAYGFPVGRQLVPAYVDEKLSLNSIVDACYMANFINCQLHTFELPFDPMGEIEVLRRALPTGENATEVAQALLFDARLAKVRYEVHVRQVGLDRADGVQYAEAVHKYHTFTTQHGVGRVVV